MHVYLFAKNMDKNICKQLIGNCMKKILNHVKQSASNVIETTSASVEEQKQLLMQLTVKMLIELQGLNKKKKNFKKMETLKNDIYRQRKDTID